MGRIKDSIKVLFGIKPKPIHELYAVPKMIESDRKLDGKIALVIGASGGIGAEISEVFIRNGCKVILATRNEKHLHDVFESMRQKYGEDVVRAYQIDIYDIDNLSNSVKSAISQFHENRIDILVNAAGINTHTSFWDFTCEEYDRIMNINVRGVFFSSQIVAKIMRENNIKGHILNISSASSLRPAWTPYEMSKWTISGFTKGLADLCLPYGIVVNAIAPGPVATNMLGKSSEDNIRNGHTLSGRYALPCEIAELAVFMVSDFGDLIVGDTFYISGGSGVISYHR